MVVEEEKNRGGDEIDEMSQRKKIRIKNGAS
jgi:hypothetical protein